MKSSTVHFGMSDQGIKLNRFASKAAVSVEIAQDIVEYAASCIRDKSSFHIAWSGGSLPAIVCERLARQPLVAQIDWSKWHIWLVDERCVSLDHADSSWRLVQEHLLSREGVGIPPENLHPLPQCARFAVAPVATGHTGDAERLVKQAAEEYAAEMLISIVTKSNGMPAVDLCLLGFGPDGHTASLFPGRDHDDERYAKAGGAFLRSPSVMTYVTDSPKPPPMRITMSLSCILASRKICVVGCGCDKAPVLQGVFKDGTMGGIGVGPVLTIAKVIFQHTNISVWTDDAACELLQ
jgi:6-phosphogluconolactonase